MPRTARYAPGGLVYHVLNRGVGRRTLFFKEADYAAFEGLMLETLAKRPLQLLGYCLMPNHWHLVVLPREASDLAEFMRRLTVTHAIRWQKHRQVVGEGHLYQGRYKSFPVESDEHFVRVLRYVERNALRSNLASSAEAWRWSSLWRRTSGSGEQRAVLAPWPVTEPRGASWVARVNAVETEAELAAIRQSIRRGRPFGSPHWVERTARRLGLQATLRPRGRPRKPR